MDAMAMTTREELKSVLQSVCHTLSLLGRGVRNFFRIFNEGYLAKNCQWMRDSQEQQKKH